MGTERVDRRGSFYNFIVARKQRDISFYLSPRQMQTAKEGTKKSRMLHLEGGWPEEINVTDEEAVLRFRRRVERSENWALRMKKLTDVSRFEISIMEHILYCWRCF